MLRSILGRTMCYRISICQMSSLRGFSASHSQVSDVNFTSSKLFFSPLVPKVNPIIQRDLPRKDIISSLIPQYLPTPVMIPHLIEDLPSTLGDPSLPKLEKQAARLVVIRRRKMKKHKLRKLRKVRKFEYIRVALKRKTQKEKEFQMKLMAQIKEAEKFNAKSYIEDIIRIAKEDLTVKKKHNPAFKRNPSLYDEDGNRLKLNLHLYGKK